uniref:NACHT, LRR and PYD domains-containing protein 9 n=1 Tax=Castor canadensis TaxID=51338 RepID=A0A8C0W2C5_CASCN
MAEPRFSEFGLVWYLEELKKEEFWKFKELLRQEPQKFQLKPMPWTDIKRASKEGLAKLLYKHFSGKQVWDVVMSLFLQISRRDLWQKKKKHFLSKLYKRHMKQKFQLIWQTETCLPIPGYFYNETIRNEYIALQDIYTAETGPVTVALRGDDGIGKTTFLRRVMLDWASGIFLNERFRFVFFLTVCDMNSMMQTSLIEFISRDWPESSGTIGDVFSQPERILFIMDDFEKLKFDLELRTNLCDDWRRRQPPQIILSSLLQKKLLPESSLLLALQDEHMQDIYFLLKYPKDIFCTGLSEDSRRLYFTYFFRAKDKASRALSFVKSQPPFFLVCSNPFRCWVICTSLKWQLEIGDDLELHPGSAASVFVTFFRSAFKARSENCPSKNKAQLKSLCALAAEGIWTHTFVFSCEDLRRHGGSESDVLVWMSMRLLQKKGDCFTFKRVSIQDFCAALFYFLKESTDHPNPAIGSVAQLVTAIVVHKQHYLIQLGIYLFGILPETMNNHLETSFGFLLSKDIKQEIIQCFLSISQCEHNKNISFQQVFGYLFETQDEEFVKKVMDLFDEVSLTFSELEPFIMASFCLRLSQKLKKLRLRVHKISSYKHTASAGNDIQYWQDFCSVFTVSRNLQVLELDNCNLNNCCMGVLFKALAQPVCSLRSLSFNFMPNLGDGADFSRGIIHNPQLKHLNLYGTGFSHSGIKCLCEALQHPVCNVEELVLGKCDITGEDCENLVSLIIYKKLKYLSLVENPVKNKGAMVLCEALKHSNCALETLMLSYCGLSCTACDYFSQALLCNRSLSVLDLGSNVLENNGVAVLCEALKNPGCSLQELWLTGCYLTSDGCKNISAALICNEKLHTLKLGNNNIQDAGVKHLCEALRHPKCKLQRLGLNMCQLTSECCEGLASALTFCKTLRGLNLDWITLDHDGVLVLCEALSHHDCALETLGLDKSSFGEETQMLLQALEEKIPHLTITHHPWFEEELRMKGVPQ